MDTTLIRFAEDVQEKINRIQAKVEELQGKIDKLQEQAKPNEINEVEIIEDEKEEWQILRLNEEVFAEGHFLTNDDWFDLLQELGISVKRVIKEDI